MHESGVVKGGKTVKGWKLRPCNTQCLARYANNCVASDREGEVCTHGCASPGPPFMGGGESMEVYKEMLDPGKGKMGGEPYKPSPTPVQTQSSHTQ